MSAFVSGKALLKSEATTAIERLQQFQVSRRQILEQISSKNFERWKISGIAEGQSSRKLALLCGHPRSGTTLLEYVLDSHPQIVSADETFVFSNKAHFLLDRGRPTLPPVIPLLDAMTPRTIKQTRAEYFRGVDSFLGQPVGDRVLIDKNPVLTPDILPFHRIFPESKFLVALRDPRDVCLSCFMQSAALSHDSASWLTLEGTLQNYASIMNVWLGLRPFLPNAIEVRYEDMVEDLESNARKVLEFLGCSWNEQVMRFDEHARGKLVRSPTYADVTKPIYNTAVGRWKNYQKYFEPYLIHLEPFFRAFGYE